MIRLALAAVVLAMVALATILYASTRDEPNVAPEPPASEEYTIVNGGVAAARRLHVEGQNFGSVEIVENAPGCPTPERTVFGLFDAEFEWSSACVDPGEEVIVRSTGDCPDCTGPVTGWRWDGE